MNVKKTLIIFSLISLMITSIIVDPCFLLASTTPYVFVKKWGEKGSKDGMFGGLSSSEAIWFKVTNNVICNLTNKINNEKLEALKYLKEREFGRDEFLKTLRYLNFNDNEIDLLIEYSCMHKPGSWYFESPLYITIDKMDNLFVTDVYNHRIQKFDNDGNFINQWGSEGSEDGQFKYPTGITVDNEGYIYVSDTWNNRIQKFDNHGNFIAKWDGIENRINLVRPTGITFHPDGYILVACGGNIIVCNVSGELIKQWSTNIPYLLYYEQIAIDLSGDIILLSNCQTNYIILSAPSVPSDTLNYYSVIQKYNSSGNLIDVIKNTKGSLDGELADRAWGMIIDKKGYLYVADTYNNRIQIFDCNGNFIAKWGIEGKEDGEFNLPIGMAFDSKGNIYVADSGNHRIQKFAPTPEFKANN